MAEAVAADGTSFDWSTLVCKSPGIMAHPGLPPAWAGAVMLAMLGILGWSLWLPGRASAPGAGSSIAGVPLLGPLVKRALTRPWALLTLRLLTATAFLLVIYAGLFGTPIPERNIATTLTWTVWWTGIIIAVFFVGSAWCAICPWDALAGWLVRRQLWRRGDPEASLNLRVPRRLRNIWPALVMFVGLTWLELGVGVTTNPYATALLALLMVILATLSLAVFERKAFCRYFCPVGRTLGTYSQLAPVALRPVDHAVCAQCKTLECYHGTDTFEPCPTHLVMGRITQNAYCTSCGACTQSCPSQNVAWQTRPLAEEVVHTPRPRRDEAWFILTLTALTSLHGLTMLPLWEGWIRGLGRALGDSGQLLWGFSLGMAGMMAVPLLLFTALVTWTRHSCGGRAPFPRLFASLALPALPLAFSYHLAHNLNHLLREAKGFGAVLANPLGVDAQPLTTAELHLRHLQPLMNQELIFAMQAGLILFGFALAVRILLNRARTLAADGMPLKGWRLTPMLLFIGVVSLFNLWLLMQPMVMRM